MGFPLVDRRVFGQGFINPAMARPPVKPPPRAGNPVPFLGVSASGALNEAAKELEKAKTYVQKIHDSYRDLAEAIGEDGAKQVFDEAQSGLKVAQRDYDTTVEITGGLK